ncbi:ABC transporter permease [Bacillus suaedaesalsae]|uniref:ABC transporter permease n=1 Tax=Bacillus suaedaesalsae TaxID=2810349 RepID=A0ABS2DFI0_9BACI|nr:ABC transporter permease [Bacillus suaedaesalsae]MBM6617202.1 ABC transporter permease [Bacillus suaedaesalsae]
MKIKDIWNKRFSEFIKEMSRYIRYMFNDHLMIVLLIALSAGALYYKQWLSQLPDGFPFEWIMGIFLGLILTMSSVRTFLKEPDLVFLLPVEHKMGAFFQRGFNYSFIVHGIMIFIAFLPFIPMYERFTAREGTDYLVLVLILLLVKGWNLLLSQKMFYFIEDSARIVDKVIRLVFNVSFLVLLFGDAPFSYLLILIIISILWLGAFYYITKNKHMLKWEVLIKEEVKLSNRFYRIANLFIDVPHLRNEVKPRRWLNFLTSSIPFQKEKVFIFLYTKTFIRSGEYLGLYVRLIFIAGFLVIGVEFPYAGLVIIPFFIYLSGLQLMALYKEHDQKLWINLYPVSDDQRLKAFLSLLLKLMIVKGMILSALLILNDGILMGLYGLVISILFSFVFVESYLKKRLIKREQ